MTNSRQKGARVEREIAAWLRELGFQQARRGQQFAGGPGSPDVVVPDLPNLRFEVKARLRFPPKTEIRKWLERAELDAGLHARAVLVVVARRVSPVIVYRDRNSVVAVLESTPNAVRELLETLNQDPTLSPSLTGPHA